MKLKFHLLIFGLYLMGISSTIYGQNREPQNIYRVTVNSRYVLENGQRTKDFFAIGQLISDSLGRLHTEIDYTWETHYPSNYRWHYFNGKTKYKTDFFVNEKLAKIEEYKTDENNRVVEHTVKRVSLPDTSILVRVVHKFNNQGKIIQSIGYNAKGKKGYTANYKYDSNGTEIERKVKGKGATPPDSIMQLTRVPQYDSLGRIAKELVTTDKVGVGKSARNYLYSYDASGNLIGYTEQDVNGKQLIRKEYTYRKDNKLQQMKLFDANNNLADWQAWRYEIYKTNDRRQRVLE